MNFKELVLHYGVLSGRRYTSEEKLEFLSNIQKEFNDLGYKTQILKKDLKRFSGLNCYIGDVVNAKNIVIANYDTPLNSFNDNIKYYPYDSVRSEKNINDKAKMRAFIVIGMFIMFFSMFFFQIKPPYLSILLVSITVIMTLLGYILMRGAPNVMNANLNTSGVLALIDLAKAKPKDSAFILTDREFVDNLGDLMVNEALPNTLAKKNVIHLKAIGRGEHIVVGFSKNNRGLAKRVANNTDVKFYELNDNAIKNHSLNYYPKAVSISVCDEFEGDYEVSNVANDKDLDIDESIYSSVVSMVNKFLNN